MPSWLSWLPDVFRDSADHWNWPWIGAALAAAGAALAAVAGAIWAVFKFRAERKKANDKKGGDTSINVGQGFGRVRDQTFQAPVNFGLSPKQIEQIQRPWVELTNKLLAQHPVATPGAQQAVEAAVQSIAQGAAEGDNMLEEVLGLLQKNKTPLASAKLVQKASGNAVMDTSAMPFLKIEALIPALSSSEPLRPGQKTHLFLLETLPTASGPSAAVV